VDTGRRPELCTQPWISHNVSNTVVVRDGEWDDVTRFIYDNRDVFAGVSLLADGGDLDYPQAPFVEVLEPKEIDSVFGRYDENDIGIVDDARFSYRDLWDAVDPVTNPANEMQKADRDAWQQRLSTLTNNSFSGDRRRSGHYLKSLYYWRKWQALTDNTVDVDYSQMVENESGVDFGQISACAGGACQIL
jgi:ribonucleoside-diphosphate reductase alpha chain